MNKTSSTATDNEIGVDILIIGAGPPAGLYGAYYAGFRGLSVAVIDALAEPGGTGQCDVPGEGDPRHRGIPFGQGTQPHRGFDGAGCPVRSGVPSGHAARELSHDDDGRVRITTSTGQVVVAGAVVITGGIGTFTPRPLAKGSEFMDRGGLSYFVPDLSAHTGKDVVIVGGGDSAFDWAVHLEPIAKSVTLVHRRDRFRAHKSTVAKVQESSVQVLVNADVSAVRGNGWIGEVDITHKQDKSTSTLPAQSVIAALGFTADLGPMMEWGGIEIDNRHIAVNTRMETNVPRVYAAGDITDYPGKVRLIAVGFGEAATAVNNAAAVLDPEAEIFPGHSTEQES